MTRNVSMFLLLAGVTAAPAQAPVYHDPGLKTIVQVAIVVKDIESASKHWAALLGVPQPKITLTRPGSEVKVVYRGRPSNGQAKLAFFRMGQAALELIEPVGEGTSWKNHLDKYGEGVQHLGFQVTDLERTAAALKALGFEQEHSGRYDADNGTYIYFDSRKDLGVTVELLHSDPKK